MADQNHRSTTLRRYRAELKRVSDEAQAALMKAEDSLTAIEDRETRRAGRTNESQATLDAIRLRG